jgi:hypothetical protein
MGLTNNAQLVHYAFQNNLVEKPSLAPGLLPAAADAVSPTAKATAAARHARLIRLRATVTPSRPPTRRPF